MTYRDIEEQEAEQLRREEWRARLDRHAAPPLDSPPMGGPLIMSQDEYRRSPGLSTSELKAFAAGPGKERSGPTPSMIFGTRLESLLLGRPVDFVEQPADIPMRRGARWEAFAAQAANDGLEVIRPSERDSLVQAIAAFMECTRAVDLVSGIRWPKFFWFDEVDGSAILRRAELDVLRPDVIVDLKTTVDPTPRAFANQSEELRYHWQAASYQQAVKECVGDTLPVVFVVIRNTPPYDVELYEMRQSWIDRGLREIHREIPGYLRWKETGYWRSPRWNTIIELSEPRWAKYQHDYSID